MSLKKLLCCNIQLDNFLLATVRLQFLLAAATAGVGQASLQTLEMAARSGKEGIIVNEHNQGQSAERGWPRPTTTVSESKEIEIRIFRPGNKSVFLWVGPRYIRRSHISPLPPVPAKRETEGGRRNRG